jgi:hypothetical protein
MPEMSNELIEAIEATAVGFAAVGAGLERVAAALRAPQLEVGPAEERSETASAFRVARQLSRRLGIENQDLLLRSAEAFPPGVEFSLADLAEAAGITPGSARARLMNIGRSLKAIGGRNVLWRARRDEKTEQTIYHWTSEGRAAVLQAFS